MPLAAVISFRLGGTDGVSIEAAKWCSALRRLGFQVRTVAGEGVADVQVPGLGRIETGPSVDDLASALDGADVVVVENLLSLPLNPSATDAAATVLRGRPAVVRHHDLPWQRPSTPARPTWATVATDSRWGHVVLNTTSRRSLAERGVEAVVLHNRFPLDAWHTDPGTQVPEGRPRPLLLHPVRAIPRKNVPAAIVLAEQLGATYWLTGPPEDGYDSELDSLLRAARCPIRRDSVDLVTEAYASADAVAFPSTWEGFGNPVIESALARRPLAVSRYPVLVEDLAPFGFRWFEPSDAASLSEFLARPDTGLLDHNEEIARAWFGDDRLPGELAGVLERVL